MKKLIQILFVCGLVFLMGGTAGGKTLQYAIDLLEEEGKDNKKQAFEIIKSLAEEGDSEAFIVLGNFYRLGMGVSKDFKESVKWYRLAAEQGQSGGMSWLGRMYKDGLGVLKDSKEAIKWYSLAIENGASKSALGPEIVEAQFNLGMMYWKRDGDGDIETANKWLRLAAEQGYAEAQFNLGRMTFAGPTTLKWYRLAAEQGHIEAQYNLGFLYAKGHGVPQDYKEAVKWFRLSADQGYAEAKLSLKEVLKKLETHKAEEAVTKEGTAEIVITVTSMGKSSRTEKMCKLKFDITNNAYGTLDRIDARLTGFDDRGREVDNSPAYASNDKGFDRIPIALGSIITGFGYVLFNEECKYLTEVKFEGIYDEHCGMRMLPENVSCSKFTILKSNVPSLKIKNGAKK
jgi:uncharacterized protein